MIRVPRCQGNQHQQISGRWSGSPDVREININKCPEDDQGPQMSGKSTSTNIRKMIRVPRCQGNQRQQISRRWSGSPDVRERRLRACGRGLWLAVFSACTCCCLVDSDVSLCKCYPTDQESRETKQKSRECSESSFRCQINQSRTSIQKMSRIFSQMSGKWTPSKCLGDVQNSQSDVREINPKQVSRGCLEFWTRCQRNQSQTSVQGMFRILNQMSEKSIPNKCPGDVQNSQSDVREINPKQVSRGCSEFWIRCQGNQSQTSVQGMLRILNQMSGKSTLTPPQVLQYKLS